MLSGRPESNGGYRLAVTGSGGLIGVPLVACLEAAGHRVFRVIRRAPRANSNEIQWDPLGGTIDAGGLSGIQAVVHLAGENIAAGRWTPARKEALRHSRVEGTRLLSTALANLKPPPNVLVSASAVGYYGDRGDAVLTEVSERGQGFLPAICQEWEDATAPARAAGIRVVNLRIGMVLSREGGALAKILTPFKAGIGGKLGTGRQYMSWIARDDLVELIHYTLTHDDLDGPVNAVAPNPITNAEFTRTLGRVIHRPTIFPVPALALRLVFGQMADDLLLASARVLPAKAQATAFEFHYAELEAALRAELGR